MTRSMPYKTLILMQNRQRQASSRTGTNEETESQAAAPESR